jgi:hypothetical protein
MDWIKSILPTIGGLLGGPLGSAAITAVAETLGLGDKSKESVEKALSSNLTAEQISALKKADADLQTKLAELGIEADRISQVNQADARAMQVATHSWVPSALACVVTLGFFAILIGLLTGWLKLWESTTLSLLIGSLSTAFSSVLAFYYGASFKLPEAKK